MWNPLEFSVSLSVLTVWHEIPLNAMWNPLRRYVKSVDLRAPGPWGANQDLFGAMEYHCCFMALLIGSEWKRLLLTGDFFLAPRFVTCDVYRFDHVCSFVVVLWEIQTWFHRICMDSYAVFVFNYPVILETIILYVCRSSAWQVTTKTVMSRRSIAWIDKWAYKPWDPDGTHTNFL